MKFYIDWPIVQVVQVKSEPSEGYTALQVGCGSKRDKQLNGRQLGHYRSARVDNKRKLAEFRVSEDAVLPVGFELSAAHFVPGQFLDIAGMTIGKGFQGVMKRHGFKGQPASHGNSLAHRAPGGIGACQDPGKVWPGKKMPGRMGNKRRTVQSVWVYKVSLINTFNIQWLSTCCVYIRLSQLPTLILTVCYSIYV